MGKCKFKHGVMILIFCFLISFNVANAKENGNSKNVLFISSYNPNYITFNDQIEGIKEEMGKNVIMQIEYMDFRVFSDEESEHDFYTLLKNKINNYKKFDAIILADDSALDFGIKYREDLFENIPMVFLGVSDFDKINKAIKLDEVYGVVEELSIDKNLELISKFHSGKNIIALTDESTYNSPEIKTFYSLSSKYKNLNFKYLSSYNMSTEEFKNTLNKLGNEDILLVVYAYRNKSGDAMTIEERANFILQNTNVPSYCSYDFALYNKLSISEKFIGGKVIVHNEQGKKAGKIVNDILNNKVPTKRIINKEDVNKYIFNYKELKKYNIRKKDLPQNAEIINDPIDTILEYKNIIFTVAIVLISLIIVIIAFILYTIKKLHYEKELLKAKEIAESSNEAKTNFISNISHELRTPIAVVMSSNQLLELNMEKVDNEYSNSNNKNIHIIKQNCYRLLRLTNNIIDVAKVDSGFMDLRLKNIDIIYLLEAIVESVLPYAKSKNIDIVFDTTHEEIIMSVDPDKIERIVLNLISNAIKFSNESSTISVNVEKNDYILTFSVKDTGIGMDGKHLSCIFDKFTQIDDTMVRKNEGSGIGLSLVKSFVNLHQGSISVKSKVNKGSEFTIELPIKVLDKNDNTTDYNIDCVDSIIRRTSVEFSDIYF